MVLGSKCVLHCSVLHRASWLSLFFTVCIFFFYGLGFGWVFVLCTCSLSQSTRFHSPGLGWGGGCISCVISVFAARLHGLGLGLGILCLSLSRYECHHGPGLGWGRGMGGVLVLHVLGNFSLCCTSSWPGLRVGHLVSQSSRSRLGEHVLWFRTL